MGARLTEGRCNFNLPDGNYCTAVCVRSIRYMYSVYITMIIRHGYGDFVYSVVYARCLVYGYYGSASSYHQGTLQSIPYLSIGKDWTKVRIYYSSFHYTVHIFAPFPVLRLTSRFTVYGIGHVTKSPDPVPRTKPSPTCWTRLHARARARKTTSTPSFNITNITKPKSPRAGPADQCLRSGAGRASSSSICQTSLPPVRHPIDPARSNVTSPAWP